jgi:hypothetical protein
VIEPGPESLEGKLDELRTFAAARLISLAVHEAKALLAEQIGKFTLEQVAEARQDHFQSQRPDRLFWGRSTYTRA